MGNINAGKSFYVRPVYEELLSVLVRYFAVPREPRKYAITGTPGTVHLDHACTWL
jgi:hypothetical protein